MGKFKFYKQYDTMDCGPTCLRMIAKHYGKEYSLEYLRSRSYITREGVNLLGISDAAEQIGFRTLAVKTDLDKLLKDAPLPCVLHWHQNHFVVLYKVKNKQYHIADPAEGLFKVDETTFLKSWQTADNKGIALLLEVSEDFNTLNVEDKTNKKGFSFLFTYLKPYKSFVFQLFLSMLVGSGFSLIFPFLTQNLVDKGINEQNISFVSMMLFSQLALFFGSTAIEIIRSWIMLHMNSRININIISDFLIKLMKLPIKFFDTKHIGDIKQRINDHNRIQTFLTGSALSTLFSLINLLIFTVVLAIYSTKILLIFMAFSAIGIAWIVLFLKKRKEFDYIRFQRMSENESTLVELISGMQEIKLNNSEKIQRWKWERIQAKLFKLNIKSLSLGQYQQVGSSFFNQLKNIIISYISALEVINGNITLGMMMSISYIVGQLNNPIQSILSFIQSAQDAKISLDRLSEIHGMQDEETEVHRQNLSLLKVDKEGELEYAGFVSDALPQHTEEDAIKLENVSFQYQGPHSPYVLKNINLSIPKGKITAIVGMSGSGKTTLMKLLLQYYEPVSGVIKIGSHQLSELPPHWWREQCGSVMQEGYIFNDTIANNIAVCDEYPDHNKLKFAVKTANISDFINELPMGYNTKIGTMGNGVSSGQRQRILISRAVYKMPQYLFFDEATSALDANNEKIIMENLNEFYKGKTVLIIAHRLSTVKNADQIVVLEHGEI
ncbi:MAG TPA: peptidase domain-containing ABC transporter, partial [Bacteroidia bacterium]